MDIYTNHNIYSIKENNKTQHLNTVYVSEDVNCREKIYIPIVDNQYNQYYHMFFRKIETLEMNTSVSKPVKIRRTHKASCSINNCGKLCYVFNPHRLGGVCLDCKKKSDL